MNLAAFTFGEEEGIAVALGVTELASRLANLEKKPERHARKLRIVDAKKELLRQLGLDAERIEQQLRAKVADWDDMKRNALLIEIAFADPFAPYQVKVDRKDHESELGAVTEIVGLPGARAKDVLGAIGSARKAHRRIPWAKIGVTAVVGAAVLALGGYVAAPAIAAYLGGAAGLSGAAAVAHGLALLGGGSLAAGGTGMAGGMILLTGAGAAAGGLGAGGAAAFWQAGRAVALSELVKLQVSYREVLLRSHLRAVLAAEVIDKLVADLEALRKRIEEEAAMNDPGASRVTDLEGIAQGYKDAIKWIRDEKDKR